MWYFFTNLIIIFVIMKTIHSLKHIVLALSLLFWGLCIAGAQETQQNRFEVRLGVSAYPAGAALANSLGMSNFYSYELPTLDNIYVNQYGDHYTMGNIGAEFSWRAKKKLDLYAGLYFTPFWAKQYGPYADSPVKTKTTVTVSALAMLRYNYKDTENFRLYSSIGLGLLFDGSRQGSFNTGLHLQLVPIGLSFGRKVFGFAELGFGTLYMGMNVGVGYKF